DDFPNAMAYYHEAISLPMFQMMSHEQQDEVVLAVERAIQS
ncbi:DegT/DnrJ/EryC1/StrS family aminotransferase, partial [Pseudomonas aeruginosa]